MAIRKVISRSLADGAVATVDLDGNAVTPAAVSDAANTSTGGLSLPSGTTAQRPSSPDTGETRMNTTQGSLEFYDGTSWLATNLIPTLDSVTGNIVPGFSTDLTLSTTNATDSIDVVFKEGATTLATVTGVTVSSGSGTVSVPAAVHGQTAGDTITINIKNQDGTPSSNSQNKTVGTLPTGGTITTSGNYRVHTFTSSGTFAVQNVPVSADILLVAGGGGGGGGSSGSTHSAAGGGGGGMYTSTAQSLSASTNYTVTIGSGGAGNTTANSQGVSGGDTDFTGQTSAVGGGGGGTRNTSGTANHAGLNGGSGGGGVPDTGTNHVGGSGTSGQGNAGGTPDRNIGRAAAGGGGKGSAGQVPQDHTGGNGDSYNGGNGGSGGTNNYTGSTVTYAGGGGGGAANTGGPIGSAGASGNASAGGAGGDGANSGQGGSGSANTGQGAGGGSCGQVHSATTNGGTGGSGICIVRYNATTL